ncbi:MAG: SUMF1/EgtB/PvdO family nonheme iron enzyme [bacterium]
MKLQSLFFGFLLMFFITSCEFSDTVILSESDLTFTLPTGESFNMIFVDAGTFNMGATFEQKGYAASDEDSVKNISLSSYYIEQHEITQELWYAVMGTTILQQRDSVTLTYQNDTIITDWPLHGEGNLYPMYYISYKECVKFCTELNALLSDQLPEGYYFRLPTEAEWEYAARGGSKNLSSLYSGDDDISNVAWYNENSGSATREVGLKNANELGIYDMSGNVWEWCLDWYNADFYSSSKQDPINKVVTEGDTCRVIRGGGWGFGNTYCRVSNRAAGSSGAIKTSDKRSGFLGFRLALVLESL